MIKENLPVIILKGIILLPNNEIRLEFDNTNSNVIDIAEMFHDNEILIVNQNNPLEETPDKNDLPRIGVIGKITHKVELPNGKTRIIIKGIKRANIHEYLNHSADVIESIISETSFKKIDEDVEEVTIKKLYQEVERYIKSVPYISNSVISLIMNVTELDKMTDIIASQIPISIDRKKDYLFEIDPSKRAEMILEDIYREEEMFKIEKEIDAKVKKDLDAGQKEYILREKIKAIQEELGDISYKDVELDELREKISLFDGPTNIKERLKHELRKLSFASFGSPEVGTIRTYIDWLLSLPWNKETIDNFDLKDARSKLDKTHYGLDNVKKRVIEYLAVKQKTNDLKTPIICLVGPPGVGKTSFAYSIAESINRNFAKISLGGISDEAEILGHRKTYIGASPGRIINALKKSGSINPVILIDEIDKLSKDYKGDPASALLSVLDPEQNRFFSDNYIEEEIDLSRVMFIATANYIEEIPDVLKDRLEIINIDGYTEYEKVDIAKKHLLPKIYNMHGVNDEVTFGNRVLINIIRKYTKESGVRELERLLSSVVRKIVSKSVINKEKLEKVIINDKKITEYLGNPKYEYNEKISNDSGIVNGLAYTNYGGDVLNIEVNYYRGNGNLVLTGSLGSVMKESALVALSYIKANYKKFDIDYNKLIENDIHIHVPGGAVPKEGPSAGVAITTAIISAFTEKEVPSNLALTGEITLRGKILPIGGIKEKSLGASRCMIKEIIIPNKNEHDLDEIPEEIKKNITYIPVNNYEEIYKKIFGWYNEYRIFNEIKIFIWINE